MGVSFTELASSPPAPPGTELKVTSKRFGIYDNKGPLRNRDPQSSRIPFIIRTPMRYPYFRKPPLWNPNLRTGVSGLNNVVHGLGLSPGLEAGYVRGWIRGTLGDKDPLNKVPV